MSGGNPIRQVVRFGVFEVDLRQGELRRNGLTVKLREQSFQLLAALLERRGDLVTREELRGKLWAADTFVDFDHSLNAAMKRLRDALGDDPDNPRFIETVPRRGYRFLGDAGARTGTAGEIRASPGDERRAFAFPPSCSRACADSLDRRRLRVWHRALHLSRSDIDGQSTHEDCSPDNFPRLQSRPCSLGGR
jgi:DNA-binding winged helix-turn-helix (wHTH) protein